MVIVADHKIPFLKETFGRFAEVQEYPSTQLTREVVAGADSLLVRSETVVDSSLLEGSRVRFVGSPTIGVDHIDQSFLADAGIAFSNAPGCNARSVVEYVLTALATLAQQRGTSLEGSTIGIVGVGNIGSRLALAAESLGLEVLLNDPPRQLIEPQLGFLELAELLSADFISLHVPLQTGGSYPTHHLIDDSLLSRIQPKAVLINSSRGAVVDNQALLQAIRSGSLAGAVLDVWENEPLADPALVEAVNLATPHIAGYTLDGKLRGTWAVFEAFCRCFELDAHLPEPPRLPSPDPEILELDIGAEEPWKALYGLLQQAYPIWRDDREMRRIMATGDEGARGKQFRSLRANYPLRREFSSFKYPAEVFGSLKQSLEALGFGSAS